MDLYPEAVAFAGERAACEVVVGDVLKPPNLGRFDVIGMFDVLEHLSNDSQIAGGLNRMLKSDGILILTVPAHLLLWSYFDIASRHCRRYERCELTRIVEGNGLKIEYVTEFMMSLYPLMWVVRRMRYRHGTMNSELAVERADAELRIIPVVNGLLKAILTFEAFAVARRWRLPLGHRF
jgi:SAM-dependent methyltransferase